MTTATRRRLIALDRSLELLPLFRLSDSAEDAAIAYTTPDGRRWRVLPAPGDRVPGTFDQDVYIELLHRFHEAGTPSDGALTFTLHAFLRAMGRAVDGRTYEQLRGALLRLERTGLESQGGYWDATHQRWADLRFTVLASVTIARRRAAERDQLPLFPDVLSGDPGDVRAVLAAPLRANLAAHHASALSPTIYRALGSPVARRLYRLLAAVAAGGDAGWEVELERLADQLPLAQRYPSHLQRVLQPAHAMLEEAGAVRNAALVQRGRAWVVAYDLAGVAA
ncbi:MAG TPA: replication initiator protein A [Gemmatimonadaceae bacterium]|nr:replication initiator protein A [Gemmatimonadaceae bacterium]